MTYCDHYERELAADARADAQYCSSPCRQAAYRHRKEAFAPYGGTAEAVFEALVLGRVTDKGDG